MYCKYCKWSKPFEQLAKTLMSTRLGLVEMQFIKWENTRPGRLVLCSRKSCKFVFNLFNVIICWISALELFSIHLDFSLISFIFIFILLFFHPFLSGETKETITMRSRIYVLLHKINYFKIWWEKTSSDIAQDHWLKYAYVH